MISKRCSKRNKAILAFYATIPLLALVLFDGCGGRATSQYQDSRVTSIIYLAQNNGGRVDWSEKKSLLACDLLGNDGYYKVWTMEPDGGNPICLSRLNSQLPIGHHGNPAWHPSGDYLVLQCCDPALKDPSEESAAYLYYTNPGSGYHNNLWMITSDGTKAWQLTSVARNGGVLHPHFSPDGTKLVWAEMISPTPKPLGTWMMKMADFTIKGGAPLLENVKVLRPGEMEFYETHGFSPDGSTLIFSALRKGGSAWDLDIYACDLSGSSLKVLTDPDERQWDEHAHFTPDGENIIWMSSAGIEQRHISMDHLKTDYWIMRSDGSGKRRITFFNQEGFIEYMPEGAVAADLSIKGDGRHFFAFIKRSQTKMQGVIVRLEISL